MRREGGLSGPDRISGRKRLLFIALIAAGAPLVSFLVLEGGSSLFLLGRDIVRGAFVRHERPITQYDTLLGWANPPGLYLPDYYGPGKHLRINSQGFRGTADVPLRKLPGRLRVICSGDSFTFGDGVGNDDTWCARLAQHHPAIEPVNMGQRGYGVDQAYLWFQRDGVRLHPDVHLFTFIWEDFIRMEVTSFWGASKPVLRLDGDELRPGNVPVPQASSKFPRLARFGREVWAALHGLRAYELAQSLREQAAGPAGIQAPRDSMTWAVASRAIADLAEAHRKNGTVFVVVHMAERLDVPGSEGSAPTAREWRRRVRAAAGRLGYFYLDLGAKLEQLPPDSQVVLFIPPANPHYSPAGHAWVAARIYEYLATVPPLQPQLADRAQFRPIVARASRRLPYLQESGRAKRLGGHVR
jgi:hypothetical protein